jgi:hypothetical protein
VGGKNVVSTSVGTVVRPKCGVAECCDAGSLVAITSVGTNVGETVGGNHVGSGLVAAEGVVLGIEVGVVLGRVATLVGRKVRRFVGTLDVETGEATGEIGESDVTANAGEKLRADVGATDCAIIIGEATGKIGESAFVTTDAGARVSEAVLASVGPNV